MPALDTNVLIRYLVEDDSAQTTAARRLVRQAVASGEELFVPVTVTLELEWVLRSSFGLGKDEILRWLSDLFSTAELSFQHEQALEVALELYRGSAAGFADCLHIALAAQAEALPMHTFDKAAAKVGGAQLVR